MSFTSCPYEVSYIQPITVSIQQIATVFLTVAIRLKIIYESHIQT